MRFNLHILFVLTIAYAGCKTSEQHRRDRKFNIELKSISADTVVTSAVYLNGHIICLQADHKIFVLDSLLEGDMDLTQKFSNKKFEFLQSWNSDVLVGTEDSLCVLGNDFQLRKYLQPPFKYAFPYYSDETYFVYACSAGEFGGAVFFQDKKTNKTYSYPATAVQQVLKFGDSYVVSSYLAHMSGISDYLFIKDPTNLYQLKSERQKNFCNWYLDVDTLKGKLFEKSTVPGLQYYSDSFITRTLTTFRYNKELYSIYCTDSATILARFQNMSLMPIDTLLPYSLYFYRAKTDLKDNTIVTAYEATWAIGTEDGSSKPFQNSGLIFIRNNKITFVQFQTPHMPLNKGD